MHYTDKGCEGLTLCYIGGGSQGWAWKLMSDLYLEPALSGTVRLYDIDRPAAERNEAIGNRMAAYEGAQGQWKYEVADSLEQGLQGADFVVVSILPATFEEMESDVHVPEKYGIWQSVGDTTGPGGLFRALRTLPMYEVIARAIREVCPKAWVINYTNPMALCTAALYQVFPDIKAFGCCHEVFGAQRLMLLALSELAGIQEADRHTLRTNVLGVNHFTWINEASYKGLDLASLYHKFAEKHAGGISEKQTDPHFMSKNLVKFDLLRKTGVIAAAGDRHLAEFVPAAYLGDERTPDSWGFMLTPVSWRVQEKKRLDALSRAYAAGQKRIPIEPSGEEGVMQMKALLGLGEIVTNVNLPNRGQLPGAGDAVVETNALFARDSVRPVLAGEIPHSIQPLLQPHLDNQTRILHACLNHDLAAAFDAFCHEPMVAALSKKDAKELFCSMTEGTKEYLAVYR